MSIVDVSIYFVIAILGVAYPILLQVVTRLDEKYGSLIIIGLFKQEWEWFWFRLAIALSLFFIGLYVASGLDFIDSGLFKQTLNGFSKYFITLYTVILIVSFLFFVRKILVYYNPQDLIEYFDKKEETHDYIYFRALTDILHITIRMQDLALAQILSKHFYKYFKMYRERFKGEDVLYPRQYYIMVYQTIVELIPFKSKKLAFLGHRTVGGIWLIGEGNLKPIAENTYNWIWNNLALSVENERDDFIMDHWSHSHQVFDSSYFNIRHVTEIIEGRITIANQDHIDKVNKERRNFLELQYALGGMLLYKKRYSCIRRMFDFTMSYPPQYVLLPRDMTFIFEQFMWFWDPYNSNFPTMIKYSFPDMEGINAEGKAKNWICQYIAILFLRQYQLISYLYNYDPMAMPDLPGSQSNRQNWINHLPHFKSFISMVRDNNTLLNVLQLEKITDVWCEENGKLAPNTYIDNVISQLRVQYN